MILGLKAGGYVAPKVGTIAITVQLPAYIRLSRNGAKPLR